jgi:molybdopterin/thiamine biosynthesis adenylyltransferase/rhodanese-related sulfurtransferase
MRYPPLVAPGPALSAEQTRRLMRHLVLPDVGEIGQRRLAAARVLVVGAGGLGSPVITYLAAAGVGQITVVDDDIVEESNLQRQVLHRSSDVGRAKVESAADAVARLGAGTDVRIVPGRFTSVTGPALVADQHLVVDGSDNFATRYAVNDTCAAAAIPLVWGSILAMAGQVSVWWAGHGPCYRCIFPDPPPEGSVASCVEAGVLGALCGVVGSVMATQALLLVTGTGEPLVGRLLLHDAAAGTFDTLPLRANPGCATCADRSPITPVAESELIRPGGPGPAGGTAGARPPAVEIDVADLLIELAGAPAPLLVDVRPEAERAAMPGPDALAVPLEDFRSGVAFQTPWPSDRALVMVCHSGTRSLEAALLARAAGLNACSLRGGVLAWQSR